MSWSMPPLSDRVLGTARVNFAASPSCCSSASSASVSHCRTTTTLKRGSTAAAMICPAIPSRLPSTCSGIFIPRRAGLSTNLTGADFLAWKLPEFQVLLDGRTQLYTPEFWRQAYLDDPRETTQLLKTIIADAAILPAGKSRFRDHCTSWWSERLSIPAFTRCSCLQAMSPKPIAIHKNKAHGSRSVGFLHKLNLTGIRDSPRTGDEVRHG